jgi:hypothetical protein
MNKQSLKKTPEHAQHALTDHGVQAVDASQWVGAANLTDFDPPLLQLRVWTHSAGWSQIILDEDHNVVALVGPFEREKDSFKAMQTTLENKGF